MKSGREWIDFLALPTIGLLRTNVACSFALVSSSMFLVFVD